MEVGVLFFKLITRMRKYMLSTGKTTDRIEYYVLDLFRLYLGIYPGDIPGAPDLGFDFCLTSTFKANLASEVSSRVNRLVDKIQSQFKEGLEIKVDSIEILDEKYARLVVSVTGVKGEEIIVSLYDE